MSPSHPQAHTGLQIADVHVAEKPSIGSEILVDLLERSHTIAPDAIAASVGRAAARAGLADVVLYLVNYEQTELVPIPGATTDERLPVDSTMAGRAYSSGRVLTTAAEPSGQRLLVPLLDGGERLGVMAATTCHEDDGIIRLCTGLASLAALLLVTKDRYTDLNKVVRRSRPMNLETELQREILPPLTFVNPKVVLAGVLENAYEAAGDAFDYAVNGSTASFAIFDAVGHGMAASLMSAAVVGGYRNARRRNLDLVETYEFLDSVVRQEFGDAALVTSDLGTLDVGTGELRLVNAGHPQPLVVRQGRSVNTLECEPSPPLGLGLPVHQVTEARIDPGERVLFFSDGVVEARAPGGAPFGEERLADLLGRESAASVDAAETMRRLLRAVLAHHGPDLVDDATMLLVECPSAGG